MMRDVALLPGESKDEYLDFTGQIEADLQPLTPTEFIFVSRFVQVQWDIRRVHSWKDQLKSGSATEAFIALMESHLKEIDRNARIALWRNGHPDKKTRKLMREAGLSKTAIVAQAVAEHLELFEALEVMETRLEMRGHTLLHELERHREAQERHSRKGIEDAPIFSPKDTAPK